MIDAGQEWEIAHSEKSFGGNFGSADNAWLSVFFGYTCAQESGSTGLGTGSIGQCCWCS